VRENTLAAAVDLFWKQGIAETSYVDLVKVSGSSRKALYRTWPDKTALVHDALKFYVAELREMMIAPFWGNGRDGIDGFLKTFLAGTRQVGWNGCFLMRSASGPLREDVEVAKIYADYVDELTELLTTNVQLAIKNGEGEFQTSPLRIGRQFLALAIMMSVFASQSNQDAAIEAIRDDMQELLLVAA